MRLKLEIVAACVACATAIDCGAAEHVVTMKGIQYQPARVQAKVGDTLRFVNDDSVEHNVFVPTKGYAVDLGVQKPAQAVELRLTREGRFDVERVMHPHMMLKVEVGSGR